MSPYRVISCENCLRHFDYNERMRSLGGKNEIINNEKQFFNLIFILIDLLLFGIVSYQKRFLKSKNEEK